MLVLPAKGGMVANCCRRILPSGRGRRRGRAFCCAGRKGMRPGSRSRLPRKEGRAAERKNGAEVAPVCPFPSETKTVRKREPRAGAGRHGSGGVRVCRAGKGTGVFFLWYQSLFMRILLRAGKRSWRKGAACAAGKRGRSACCRNGKGGPGAALRCAKRFQSALKGTGMISPRRNTRLSFQPSAAA